MTEAQRAFRVRTAQKAETIDITERVREAVRASKIAAGICVVNVTHTTAGVFVNENADPDVQRDLLAALERLVPDDDEYRHAEGNAPGHIKSVLVGTDVSLAVHDGDLALGCWQGIFLAEFDGPRDRHVTVTVVGEAER